MKKYICQFCGKSTKDVDYDYLVGYDHLACVLADMPDIPAKLKKKKPIEISNWDKLAGNKFDVMGASFIISVAHTDSIDDGNVYTAWVHAEDDNEPFVRVTLFTDNMDMQVKVLPPIEYDSNMTPYDLTSTITKNHVSNPSIFIQTIAEGLASDSITRDILSYISRKQDNLRFKGKGYSSRFGNNGSSGNNLW
ncbi:MAG: hypothetical protein RLZZ196_680 [Bacteroidota bacterium]|jgi:hypothetical protein